MDGIAEMALGTPREYELGSCPRCGATLFSDMGVCYNCLYDFERGFGNAPEEGHDHDGWEVPEEDRAAGPGPWEALVAAGAGGMGAQATLAHPGERDADLAPRGGEMVADGLSPWEPLALAPALGLSGESMVAIGEEPWSPEPLGAQEDSWDPLLWDLDRTRPLDVPPSVVDEATQDGEAGMVDPWDGSPWAEAEWSWPDGSAEVGKPGEVVALGAPATGPQAVVDLYLGGMRIPVSVGRGLLVGRSPDCDLVLDDPHVSRCHLTIRPVPGGLEVEDHGALNPALLGERILRGRMPWRPGEVLRICDAMFFPASLDPSE